MNAKKLTAVVLMIAIIVIGATVLRSEIAHSQADEVGQAPPSPGADQMYWRSATSSEKTAAIKSITAQLVAFKQDNYDAAVTYQSIDLRTHFQSTALFRHMMQQGYPQFAHYKSVAFGNTRAAGGHMVAIQATVTGQDGVTVKCVYFMHLEQGQYKVAGVMGGAAPTLPTAGAERSL